MITVKFFGLIRVDNNISQIFVNEGRASQVLKEIRIAYPGISEQQLIQAIMFVNKNQITGNKRFSMVLKDGDELVFISPSSGG